MCSYRTQIDGAAGNRGRGKFITGELKLRSKFRPRGSCGGELSTCLMFVFWGGNLWGKARSGPFSLCPHFQAHF
jgi:hypothetical protein